MNKLYLLLCIALCIARLESFQISRCLNHRPSSIVRSDDVTKGITYNSFKSSRFGLYAKKKASKLVSDDFLATLESEEQSDISESESGIINLDDDIKSKKSKDKNAKKDMKPETATSSNKINEKSSDNTNSEGSSFKSSKKDKKLEKLGISLDGLNLDDDIDTETTDSKKYTAVKESTLVAVTADEPVVVAEQKQRRERASSRIRFAESSQPDFVMMALENVGLVMGNNVVLKNASLSVCTGERVGLVGPNGGGKTTQLRILAGEIDPSTGEVVKSSRNMRIAFLRQEFIDELDVKRTLKEELRTAFVEEKKILEEISELEEEVTRTTDDPARMEEVLNKLANLQEQAITRGAYALDSKVEKIMDSVGFSTSDHSSLVGTFSGGWKMRIGLAKILLQEPNILLLDEPTNHLDLDSVYWLEDFLTKQNIPMVVVSHDREFLDRVCNKIVEVEDGVTYSYLGNYSKYLDQRRARLETWRDQYEKQMKFVKEEEAWIKKAKNDPSMSSSIRSREIALEKLKNSEDFIPQPPKGKRFRFRFPPAPRCSANLIDGSEITHGYGDSNLFENVAVEVCLGDRVGFVGPNGSGKSTLMRIMAVLEDPKNGYCDHSGNVVCNFFEQNQADALDLDKTVFATIAEASPSEYSTTDIRTLLGQFMFKGDDVEKTIRMLSGGEKARVALCKMMLTPANLLLLDEPTVS
jgi:ATP-binding cassette, subfamily F, member 3